MPELSGTVSVPSDDPRIDRYRRVDSGDPSYSASWYSVVEGGCWWWDFHFTEGTPASFAAEIDGTVRATNRSDINATLADDFPDKSL